MARHGCAAHRLKYQRKDRTYESKLNIHRHASIRSPGPPPWAPSDQAEALGFGRFDALHAPFIFFLFTLCSLAFCFMGGYDRLGRSIWFAGTDCFWSDALTNAHHPVFEP
jgi:hypothetical protein